MLKTIKETAGHYRIKELRVHQMIRQGHIRVYKEKTMYRTPECLVDTDEIDSYFTRYPEERERWREE